METGRNPTMRHLGRTHRIDVAWTAERMQQDDMNLIKTDTKVMAADIFTKPFPDSHKEAWKRDLQLINIVDPDKFFVAPGAEVNDKKHAGGCSDAASAADTDAGEDDIDDLLDDDDDFDDWEDWYNRGKEP